MKKCLCEWCEDDAKVKGYCGKHYQQILRWSYCRRTKKDANEYIIYEDYAEIILYDKELNEKSRAIIDLDDVEKCKPCRWVLRSDGYVSTRKNSVGMKLHRFIANTPKGLHTDHLDLNKLNNRKYNLKVCTQKENNKNKGMYKTNKSGYRGVLKMISGRFSAEIRFEGKSYYLGSFDTIEEAIKARQDRELKFYGYILDDE